MPAKPVKGKSTSVFSLSPERQNEIWGIVLFTVSLLFFMCLISFRPDDLSFFTSNPSDQVHNLCGRTGAAVAGVARNAIGLTTYLLVFVGFFWAVARFSGKPPTRPYLKLLITFLFCVTVSSLFSMIGAQGREEQIYRGGVVGLLVGNQMVYYLGFWGAAVMLMTLALLCFLLVTELAFWPIVSAGAKTLQGPLEKLGAVGSKVRQVLKPTAKKAENAAPVVKTNQGVVIRGLAQDAAAGPKKKVEEPKVEREAKVEVVPPGGLFGSPKSKQDEAVAAAARKKRLTPAASAEFSLEKADVVAVPAAPLKLPELDLLTVPAAAGKGAPAKELIEQKAKLLEDSLKEFGIDAKVAEVEVGPVITRFEVEPAPGVKVQKITTLSDDLALVLKAPSIRIIAPIPGKARVGIEVPNAFAAQVTLREVLESSEFRESSSKLTLAIGKDAAGHPLVADLSDMPHLLIAGTTGSGKTVCMNTLITSLLFNATPADVRFIMVDPKMVELTPFNGLPHLILPVLTDPKKVATALHWVVGQMEDRYRLFSKLGVRNIRAYHEKQAKGELPAEEIPESLPYIVVIVDELADLMLTAQAEIEKTIARLAHLSRAVGIHMVLATQRPSVDVLTGVIKANFPARISFQVASKVDSRTVLDCMGADKLLGKGDLLFLQPGSSKLVRAQGCFLSDKEIERVVEYWKTQRAARYDESILEDMEARQGDGPSALVKDVLYDEAVRVVVDTGQASVSLLQRRMRLGYGRAARIVDMMEQEGIVGPIRGAKPREVYIKEVPSHDDEPVHR